MRAQLEAPNVEAVASVLDGPRARGAFLIRSMMEPPWSIRVEDRAPLTLVAMLRGHAWLIPDNARRRAAPTSLQRGDIAVVRGPHPYTVADDPATPPAAVIHPGQRCTTPDGKDVSQEMWLGVRTWGNALDGSTEFLVGTYRMEGEISARLLHALPAKFVLPAALELPVVRLIADQVSEDQPGQEVVLDRLIDVLLIAVVREWFSRPEAKPPGWYRALSDPVIGRALRMLHDHPAHDWSVAALADAVSVSRAALARRFTALVGEPPMAYLTGWRLALAADMLSEPNATLAEVAQRIGYSTPFALSTAFKRERGISPQQYRRRHQR